MRNRLLEAVPINNHGKVHSFEYKPSQSKLAARVGLRCRRTPLYGRLVKLLLANVYILCIKYSHCRVLTNSAALTQQRGLGLAGESPLASGRFFEGKLIHGFWFDIRKLISVTVSFRLSLMVDRLEQDASENGSRCYASGRTTRELDHYDSLLAFFSLAPIFGRPAWRQEKR